MNHSIIARNLTKRFGDFTAVDAISFEVKKGEIFGFLGANGAGKTTLVRAILNELPAERRLVVIEDTAEIEILNVPPTIEEIVYPEFIDENDVLQTHEAIIQRLTGGQLSLFDDQ